MTLKSSGLSCERLHAFGINSELRAFECMSAFEVIQECGHLNASGIVCIESVYEFKEPGMEFPETHRIFQRKLRSVNFTFVGELS